MRAEGLALERRPGDLEALRVKTIALGVQDVEGATAAGRVAMDAMSGLSSMNEFVWELLTDPHYEGKFNKLTLEAAETFYRSGRDIPQLLDTAVPAQFENGFVDVAVRIQVEAVAKSDGDPEFAERLDRCRRAQNGRTPRR